MAYAGRWMVRCATRSGVTRMLMSLRGIREVHRPRGCRPHPGRGDGLPTLLLRRSGRLDGVHTYGPGWCSAVDESCWGRPRRLDNATGKAPNSSSGPPSTATPSCSAIPAGREPIPMGPVLLDGVVDHTVVLLQHQLDRGTPPAVLGGTMNFVRLSPTSS